MNTDGTVRKKIRGIEHGGDHRWSTLDKAVMTTIEHYLDRRQSLEAILKSWNVTNLGQKSWMSTSGTMR